MSRIPTRTRRAPCPPESGWDAYELLGTDIDPAVLRLWRGTRSVVVLVPIGLVRDVDYDLWAEIRPVAEQKWAEAHGD